MPRLLPASRRWRIALAVALLAVLLALLPFLLAPRRGGLNHDGFDRITPGMTLPEVEALLGGPPGNYTRGWSLAYEITTAGLATPAVPPGSVLREWTDNDHWYQAYFGPDGRVVARHQVPGYSMRPIPFGELLRDLLGF